MFDFNLILKVIISATLLYFIVNSFLRYHIFNEMFFILFAFSTLILLIIYHDLDYKPTFLYILIGLGAIFSGLFGYFLFKKQIFYLFLAPNKGHFNRIENYLETNKDKNTHYIFTSKHFYLLRFYQSDLKSVKKLMKGLEAAESKVKIRFTICNYWQIIIFITLMVILWRF
ncbi:MAG: hypothetical protein RBR50_05345 [Candidatus Izemoplasmatales bacterium]|nr:hypothetical protein [Candidatus Izemoplasmatales bacterium]